MLQFWGSGKQTSSNDSKAPRDKTKLDLAQVKNDQDRRLLTKLDDEFVSSVMTDMSSGFTMSFEKMLHVTSINYFLYYFFPQSNKKEEAAVDAPDRFTSPFTINVTKLILLLQSSSFRSTITGIRTNSKGVEITVTKSPETNNNTISRTSEREVKERSSKIDFNDASSTEFKSSRRSISGQRPSYSRNEPQETEEEEVPARKRKRARISVSDAEETNTSETKPFNLTARSRDILAGRLSLGGNGY